MISRWQMEFVEEYARVDDDSDKELIDNDEVMLEEQVSDREVIDDSMELNYL